MKPQQETLTPAQQRVFTIIVVMLTLAFCSVFAYAYWRGTQAQVRMSKQPSVQVGAHRLKKLHIADVKRKRIQIKQGFGVQMPRSHFGGRQDNSRFWTINKFPNQSKNQTSVSTIVIAYISSPKEWSISHKGVMTIPHNAELGLYQVHYWTRKQVHDYFFEVVAAPNSGRPS